jgi:hypothetical protein
MVIVSGPEGRVTRNQSEKTLMRQFLKQINTLARLEEFAGLMDSAAEINVCCAVIETTSLVN